MIVTLTLLSVLSGIAFTVYRLVRTYKKAATLEAQVEQQDKQLEYQNEVINNLTKRHTIDDTINSMRNGDF